MHLINLLASTCTEPIFNITNELTLTDIITAGISIVTLLVNILFYIIIAPRINFKFQKKEDFLKYSSEFITYLSTINSLKNFDGVLTKIRNYSVSIQLLFKEGIAPDPLHSNMETIYQSVKERKSMISDEEIADWEIRFRSEIRELRMSLAKYTGIF